MKDEEGEIGRFCVMTQIWALPLLAPLLILRDAPSSISAPSLSLSKGACPLENVESVNRGEVSIHHRSEIHPLFEDMYSRIARARREYPPFIGGPDGASQPGI